MFRYGHSVVVVPCSQCLAGLFLMRSVESGLAGRKQTGQSHWKRMCSALNLWFGYSRRTPRVARPSVCAARARQTDVDILSAAVDRPYFPLQSAVALAVGLADRSVRQGKAMWIWVQPVAQTVISIALRKPPSVMQSYAASVWQTYFNWGCRCSATLLQWHFMSAAYTAIAFNRSVSLFGTASQTDDDMFHHPKSRPCHVNNNC